MLDYGVFVGVRGSSRDGSLKVTYSTVLPKSQICFCSYVIKQFALSTLLGHSLLSGIFIIFNISSRFTCLSVI